MKKVLIALIICASISCSKVIDHPSKDDKNTKSIIDSTMIGKPLKDPWH